MGLFGPFFQQPFVALLAFSLQLLLLFGLRLAFFHQRFGIHHRHVFGPAGA